MMEIKVTVEATSLTNAINNLAAAISGAKVQQSVSVPAMAPVATTLPAAAPANGVPTNAQFTGSTPIPAQIQQPPVQTSPLPTTAGAPATYPSPTTTTGSSAQVATPSNQPVPTAAAPMAPVPTAPTPSPVPAPTPVSNAAPVAPVAGVPLAQPPQYTIDQIMAAGAYLMDAGKINDLLNLLHSFGVQAVADLKPEQLGAFATSMRELGAKI